MTTPYTSTFPNGAAVDAALTLATTSVQPGDSATNIAVTPTGTLSSTNVQTAITALDAKIIASAIPYITALSMGAL